MCNYVFPDAEINPRQILIIFLLFFFVQSMTDDKLKEEVSQLHDDKEKYQGVAKEALKKALQEKMEISKKYQDIERWLSNLIWDSIKVWFDFILLPGV